MTFEGKIIRIYGQNDGWICFRFEDEKTKNQYTAKGSVTGAFMPDMKISMEGRFVEDKKYGRQIEIKSIDRKGSVAANYLAKCIKGVGSKLAHEIVKTYGEDCIPKIMADNSLLLNVKGIKRKKYDMIIDSLKKADNISLYFSILSFFNNDITLNQVDKIVHACNSEITTFEKIKKDPYWLIAHIEGFGFKKVDKLALASGIDLFSVERIGAAIVFTLQQMSQTGGHCFSDMETLSKEVADLVMEVPEWSSTRSMNAFRALLEADDEEKIDEYIEKSKKKEELIRWREDYYKLIDVMSDALMKNVDENLIVIEDERIYWIDLYKAETEAAEIIAQMAWEVPVKKIPTSHIRESIKEIEEDEDCKFSYEQENAVIKSLSNRISVITGGPGRGKTTILKAIIRAWNDDDNVILLAPTGRAAKRMTEASGYPASTIHRYRNKIRAEGGRPKDKLIIVDETSMLGIKLGSSLLKMARECNLVLVGDIDQLASIEAGTFMKDIIECGQVAVSYLTKGFRNNGSIAENAALLNKGKKLKDMCLDDDTHFHEATDVKIIDEVLNLYGAMLKMYGPSDIGIITPMRRRGYGSVDSINAAIRERFNPETEANPGNGSGYIVNDRVMHIKNDYRKEIINEYGTTEPGIFNGDTGTVTKIDYDEEEVTVSLDDGRTGRFTFEEMKDNFVMAFAITIHKSQGSEYKGVILVMSSQHAFFLKRNMLYTGFTRAKSEVGIVGDEKAIAIAARNIDDSIRNSTLRFKIQQNVKVKS